MAEASKPKPRNCPKCGKPLSKDRLAKRKRKCYRCERAAKRNHRQAAHDHRVTMNGFTGEDYWALYEAQGGRCAIKGCRATGATKFLAVEHDHNRGCGHDPKQWCRQCVRGLTCATHNSWFGKAADDPEVFDSCAGYLRNPPARRVLNDQG